MIQLASDLILITASITSTSLALLGVLPLDTSWSASTEWRLEAEVNVLLRVQADDEGWDVDNLLSDTDMPLSDQNTCMMDRLCKSQLEDLGLETTLQEILNLETENIIKLHLALVQDTDSDQTSKECVSLEQSLGILLLKSQQSSGSRPDLGQAVLDSPDFTLVSQTIFSNEFQLLVKTGFLERS